MSRNPAEWFSQAEYDLQSAQTLFENRRYIHAVFMCHLSIEKALKGLYAFKLDELPPKTHNLIFIVEKVKIQMPESMYDFISTLTGVSVATRYPDELKMMKNVYSKAKTKTLLEQGKEVLTWLRDQSKK
ncbi:MAG: DNA-binding protein [Deltaproteobacteria bacterium RIFCSPLOWO2_02_FULL_53_8]|nr:MAG: DNA-binding protein [Deltaproteobacteria bacterium RIFCSPLOWO2_02_FULL_53_8]